MAVAELVLVEPPAGSAAYPVELVDVTRAYLLEARARSTREAYARQWASFQKWCEEQGQPSLPAAPETIVAWMSAMASGIGFRKPRARATINQAMSAVLLEHRRAGHVLDRKHAYISEAWRGISRVKAQTETGRKAKPVHAKSRPRRASRAFGAPMGLFGNASWGTQSGAGTTSNDIFRRSFGY